jgi:hypothetical protein
MFAFPFNLCDFIIKESKKKKKKNNLQLNSHISTIWLIYCSSSDQYLPRAVFIVGGFLLRLFLLVCAPTG